MLGWLFRWRRRDQGFEWHRYVRTTIKLRREARREKAERIKQGAVEGAKAAGVAAAQGAKVAGAAAAQGAKVAGAAAAQGAKVAGSAAAQGAKAASAAAAQGAKVAGVAAGVVAREGARNLGAGSRAAAMGLGRASRVGASLAESSLDRIGDRMITWLRPLLEVLGRRNVSGPLALAGAIALVGAAVRTQMIRMFDAEAAIALAVGATCLLLSVLPRLLIGDASSLPGPFARITRRGRNLLAGALALTIATVAVFRFVPGMPQVSVPQLSGLGSGMKLPSMPSFGLAATKYVEGRATVAGDLVRVGATTVRLADIEIPDREQSCSRPGNKRWRCGEAASAAVSKLVSGKQLKCEVRGQDAQGNTLGICLDGTADINAQLVKGGHVFAVGGLMPRYSAQESEARTAKAGVWGSETPERPADWRNRMWEEARKRAPTGCPIKGQIAGSTKTYVLPWSPEYERVRVNTSKGGRWFCSEDEAISAGWKVAGR